MNCFCTVCVICYFLGVFNQRSEVICFDILQTWEIWMAWSSYLMRGMGWSTKRRFLVGPVPWNNLNLQHGFSPEFLDLTFLGVLGDFGGDISASTSSLGGGSSSHTSLTAMSAQITSHDKSHDTSHDKSHDARHMTRLMINHMTHDTSHDEWHDT